MFGSTGTNYKNLLQFLWVFTIITPVLVTSTITSETTPPVTEIITSATTLNPLADYSVDDYSFIHYENRPLLLEEIDTMGVCRAPGFKRNETDCAQFYRCVQFNITGDSTIYTIFKFTCGPGTVFDEQNSVCTWPHLANPPCELCTGPGFRRNATDCSKFYRCVDLNMEDDKKIYTIFRFSCGPGTIFDEKWSVCTWPHLANPACPNKYQ